MKGIELNVQSCGGYPSTPPTILMSLVGVQYCTHWVRGARFGVEEDRLRWFGTSVEGSYSRLGRDAGEEGTKVKK